MEQWLQQLHDVDPLKRKRAITTLAKSLAIKAVPSLEQLARQDSDPSVRALAAKAVQHINSRAPKNVVINSEHDFLKKVSSVDAQLPRKVTPRLPWLIQLLIYCIVNIVGSVLMSVLTIPQMASSVLETFTGYIPYTLFVSLSGWVEASTGQLVIAGIVLGLLSFASSLFMLLLTHLVAVYLFRGLNSFKGMLRETLIPQSILAVIIVITYLIVSSINSDSVFSLGDNQFQFGITLIGFAIYLGSYVWLGVLLNRAYEFDTGQGCLSLLFVVILSIILMTRVDFA